MSVTHPTQRHLRVFGRWVVYNEARGLYGGGAWLIRALSGEWRYSPASQFLESTYQGPPEVQRSQVAQVTRPGPMPGVPGAGLINSLGWSRGVAWPNTRPCQGRERRFESGRDRQLQLPRAHSPSSGSRHGEGAESG